MHKRKLCYITCLLTVALAACTSTTPTSIVEITGQSDGAPVGCSPRDVGERLEDLFKALNQNDLEQAMSFFGTGDRLEWYSAPEADSQIGTAYNLKDLSAYFSRRQAQHEQLQLLQFQANGWDAGRGLVHFQFNATRRADDINAGQPHPSGGKGAFFCNQQAFIVISLGAPV